jgi:hypothetical protein
MSTSSTHQRAAVVAVAAANTEAREARIATAEAAAQQAVETARVAVAVTEAATAVVAAPHEEDADDRDGTRPRGPHRHHNILPLPV